MRYQLFISKKLFCIDCLLSAVMGLINVCVYLKFIYLEDAEAKEVMESVIGCLIMTISGLASCSLILNLLISFEKSEYIKYSDV